MRSSVFLKLAVSFLLVLAVATFTLDVIIRNAWEKSLLDDLHSSLAEKTQLFAQQMEMPGALPAEVAKRVSQTAHARATVIDRSGKVLADTEADPNGMEKHATRPEFVAALAGRVGDNVRRSQPVGGEFLYVAAPTSFGAVRLAYPITSIQERVGAVRRNLLLASTAALLLSMLLAALLAQVTVRRLQRISEFARQIAQGNLGARIEEPSLDEIGEVAAALDETAKHLEQNFAAIEKGRAQLEALLNSIQDAVLAVSADRRVQWANGAMSRLMGQGLKIGLPLTETVRDPESLRLLAECLETKEIHSAKVAVLPGRSFAATAAPIAEGGAVLVLHDVTEIERVDRTRRDFIANVSHELRTPLTSIQGYSETLREKAEPTGNTREFLDIIQQNARRMTTLTEDLLTLARVESGEQRLDLEAVPASELLEAAMRNFGPAIEAKGMKLELESTVDEQVEVDRESVYHVFQNLIDNASKYAVSGGRIVLGAQKQEGGVEFHVRDMGPGIPFEHLPRLFERFYRVDKGRSRESGGTGLGLAIVKHIVLNHGGAVRVESELNHGSTFYFVLPLADTAKQGWTHGA
ncbi:MAG: ATP-binding protein [Acidobacteriota bacterium]|nr:ATP-binding protein [Acidobacteriota bacterium]